MSNINRLVYEALTNNITDPDDLLKLTSPIQYDNFTDEEKYYST